MFCSLNTPIFTIQHDHFTTILSNQHAFLSGIPNLGSYQ